MTPTYWYIVTHYATPEVIREGDHVSLEFIIEEVKRALSERYVFACGLD